MPMLREAIRHLSRAEATSLITSPALRAIPPGQLAFAGTSSNIRSRFVRQAYPMLLRFRWLPDLLQKSVRFICGHRAGPRHYKRRYNFRPTQGLVLANTIQTLDYQ